MAHDREVAGIRCTQVLGRLSEFVDGELDAATVSQINAHLAGCDWCARFGSGFQGTLLAVREKLAAADEPDAGVRARLARRIAEAGVQS